MRTIQESIAAHNAGGAPDDVVLVLTTWPEHERESAVARQLVAERAAACVTRLPRHRVTYRWQGAIEEAEEYQWLIKTTRSALVAAWDIVRAAHPYDTPEWIVLTASGGSDPYLAWVRENTA